MNNEALVTAPASKSATSPHGIAESILGGIDWESPDRGTCTCPGAALHSSQTDGGRCAIFMDGVPTVHCFHSSCNEEVKRVNFKIRSTIGKARCKGKPYIPSIAEQLARGQRWKEKKRSEQLMAKAKASLPMIVEQFSVSPSDLREYSPVRLLGEGENDWRRHLHIFPPKSHVWVGDIYDSAGEDKADWIKAKARAHFRSVEDWLDCEAPPKGPFICPTTFAQGSASRCKANAAEMPFLVVESDTLSKDEQTAIILFLKQKYHLRAVIDTAGKSLHAWFDRPPEEDIPDLKIILQNLGCDPAMFSASQAVRLAGVPRYRKDKDQTFYMGNQSLIYLDHE